MFKLKYVKLVLFVMFLFFVKCNFAQDSIYLGEKSKYFIYENRKAYKSIEVGINDTIDYTYKELDSIINECENLETIVIDNINLYRFPNSIYRLKKLKKLVLNQTNIRIVSDSLKLLEELEYLSLCSNNLSVFPKSICSLKYLRYLNLGSTGIKYLPDCISNLKELRTIDLSGLNNLKIPHSIRKLRKIKNLLLNFCYDSYEEVPQDIFKLKSIEYINFSSLSALDMDKIRRLNPKLFFDNDSILK